MPALKKEAGYIGAGGIKGRGYADSLHMDFRPSDVVPSLPGLEVLQSYFAVAQIVILLCT